MPRQPRPPVAMSQMRRATGGVIRISCRKELLRAASSPLACLALQPVSPGEETQQLPARGPHKAHHVLGRQGLGPLAGVGLHPPAQVFASPRSQPMAASRIPDKTEWSQQGVSFSFEYRRPGCQSVLMLCVENRNRGKSRRRNVPESSASSVSVRTYCSLLNRLFEAEPSCAITSSSAVCCVSARESRVDT